MKRTKQIAAAVCHKEGKIRIEFCQVNCLLKEKIQYSLKVYDKIQNLYNIWLTMSKVHSKIIV